MRRSSLCGAALLLTGCTINPHVAGQTTFQVVEGRQLTVGFADGAFDPVGIGPVLGASGIRVVDPGARVLTEDDQSLARAAAAAHCAEFRRGLPATAGVFYPAEAAWVFGLCE